MNVLDLFSGIGGFSLGLERAGMRTVAFCEINPYCRRVLAKHWPGVPVYPDVRELTADRLRADGIAVDVICGGFPCQDISVAGKGAGIEGERSGLWSEYARIIGELRPRFVIVENVSALLGRGLDRVLGDLSALGFDAEWHCIPASAVGARHRRDRFWLVAYPNNDGFREHVQPLGQLRSGAKANPRRDGASLPLADTTRDVFSQQEAGRSVRKRVGPSRQPADVSDANDRGQSMRRLSQAFSDALFDCRHGYGRDAWLSEPDVGRVAHGIPSRVDRLRALGNAVVPQIPEIIGRAIMKSLTTCQ